MGPGVVWSAYDRWVIFCFWVGRYGVNIQQVKGHDCVRIMTFINCEFLQNLDTSALA